MNRGSGGLAVVIPFERMASMRPRFMNRGSAMSGDGGNVSAWGFNEAPIHESGKSDWSSPCPSKRRRFNEAPIHESGKSVIHGRVLLPATGFNEAPIHESGKFLGNCSDGCLREASMRPRFMNRGSGPDGIGLALGRVASMRPRFMNRGSETQFGQKSEPCGASMRPRFMNRGSQIVYPNELASVPASMRPRFMNRGSAPAGSQRVKLD